MRSLLPPLELLLVAIIVAWNILLSARIAQVRKLPRAFVLLTALAGFLLLPALAIHLASANAITARSVSAVAWLWPMTLVIFALQAIYAATRRLVNPFLGFFMSTYDLLIAVDVVLRFMAAQGWSLPAIALTYLAITSGAFAWAMQSSTSIASPFFLFVPMAAPAFPALRAWSASFRFFLALVALAWIVVILSQVPPGYEAQRSYALHDPSTEKLQERPANDLDVGIKLFPDLTGPPPPAAIRNDLALVDTLGVAVVSVTIVPEQATKAGLDSLAHTLENLRGFESKKSDTLMSISSAVGQNLDAAFDYTGLKRLRELWKGKLIVKGVARADDAERIVELGADAIWISNHGGRQLDAARATLDSLPAIVSAVGSKVPVLLDGGVRRGADMIKARALGAQAVCAGRPVLYGASAGGEAGALRALAILADELHRNMQLCGTRTIAEIDRDLIAN